MASGGMKDIKRRIKSVQSTAQITKAMELVATSKLRKAKQRAEAARPFFDTLYEVMCEIAAENPGIRSPYFRAGRGKRPLLIVIAGERGLAGGYNTNIIKMACAYANAQGKANPRVIAIGKKSAEFFEKNGYNVAAKYTGIGEHIGSQTASEIADKACAMYLKGEADEVVLFYTSFVSPLVQDPEQLQALPVPYLKEDKGASRAITSYDPSPRAVLGAIVPKYLSGMVYGAVIESFAAEQAARRTAMESANDNAGEMIDSLSLSYNRARQASITQEITEIVSGAQSIG